MAKVPPFIKFLISISLLVDSLKCPVEKVTLGAIPLIVNPILREATAALADVTPGIISCSMPYDFKVLISSVTLPNIAGSPPFKRTTHWYFSAI